MNIIKKIAFDIDGTLTDHRQLLIKEFYNFYYEKTGKPYRGRVDKTKYSYSEIFPDCDKKLSYEFETYFIPFMYDKSDYRKYVKELTNTLHNLGVEIHIITARGIMPYEDESGEPKTIKFLEDGGIYYDYFHYGVRDKVAVMKSTGCELIVEDSPSQILKISKEFPVFMMDTDYNKNISGANIWRITEDDYEPKKFNEKLKFAMNHIENDWSAEMDFSGDELFTFKDHVILVNANTKKKKSNIFFVLSAKDTVITNHELIKTLKKRYKNTTILDLSALNPDLNKNDLDPKGDKMVLSAIKKFAAKDLDLSNTEDTAVYIAKTKAIISLLKYAETHKDENFVFYGCEFMMVNRQELDKYSDVVMFIMDCGEREMNIAKSKTHVKGYNGFLFIEDLTEVSTQLRKWRIIAGTAKNELEGYHNRQWCDSEGVDRVNLLKGEKPFNPQEINHILDEDCWCIGDLHLSTKDPKKTEMIVRNINKKVSANEVLIIFGDLDGKKGTGSLELTRKTIRRLNTKKIYLILGNNDPYSIEEYVKMGFRSVVDMATMKGMSTGGKIILTHCAYPVSGDDINIHGHMHGSKCYWNVDWRNHYDIWDQDFYPIRIRDCVEKLRLGLYEAKSENHSRY